MITDHFLNGCFSLFFNENCKLKLKPSLYKDIFELLLDIEKQENFNIPITFKNKMDCLKKVLELFLQGRSRESILDSISFSEKFNQYIDFILFLQKEEKDPKFFEDVIKQIRLRRKINTLLKDYNKLYSILEKIREGNFGSMEDIIENYEDIVRTLYCNMMEENRKTTIETSRSLDLVIDNYDHVVELIKKKYLKQNTTTSGFPELDFNVLKGGGFEPSRLYIIGGGTGSGKSTLLNNFMLKSILTYPHSVDSTEIKNVYVYITMENTIEESLMRTYQALFEVDTEHLLRLIEQGYDIRQPLFDKFSSKNSTIVMKYFHPMSISPLDICGILDDVVSVYGKEKIRGLYLDYLDLLKPDIRYDLYRLELGHITLALKNIAIEYNIPVITVTQLGRGIYRVTNTDELNLDLMSESIKKVEHADFVMLLSKDQNFDGIVYAKVGKHRNGPGGKAFEFTVDFRKFLFKKAVLVSKDKDKDKVKTTLIKFPENETSLDYNQQVGQNAKKSIEDIML